MSGPAHVALLMVSVGDLGGSGGTERQFAGLFEFLRASNSGRVTLVTARSSLHRLQQAGYLDDPRGVVALPLGVRPAQSKAGIAWLTLLLAWWTWRRDVDVVHICQPTPSYLPYAALTTWLPSRWRPKVALTVVDCTLASNLLAGAPARDAYERQVVAAHQWYARWAALDGVYSWYQAFIDAAASLGWFGAAPVRAARYCFTSPRRFTPGPKQPLVVWAGRLSDQKRPVLFVDAVARLHERHPSLAQGWRFAMYGRGPLESEVRARIVAAGLSGRLELTHAIDLSPVFAASRLFVSTQALENFTSLAMLEAMSAGNAIVAENVGQTGEFVQEANGLLVAGASPDAFAEAMAGYLAAPARHDAMAAASRRLATEVHTVEHFADDIRAFWSEVAR